MKILIVGGGASGVFAALACREAAPAADIILVEKKGHLLEKVRVSGGGRCNLSHTTDSMHHLLDGYPRGKKFLRGVMERFGPDATARWFGNRGVALTAEKDGRVFPASSRSATIITMLSDALSAARINVLFNCPVCSVKKDPSANTFVCQLTGTPKEIVCDRILFATGGLRDSDISTIIEQLGHTIQAPVPSLFSFVINTPWINALPGVSVEDATISIAGTRFSQRGPLLITHRGLSGPAVLCLSSRAARYLHECNYHCSVNVAWASTLTRDRLPHMLNQMRLTDPKTPIAARSPFALSGRLWQSLVNAAHISQQKRWAELTRLEANQLADTLVTSTFTTTAMDTNKKEFVTCGGVSLKEIDAKTMESRLCKGVYFSGELMDIDGLTGGYNLQAAWATGYIAGSAMAGA